MKEELWNLVQNEYISKDNRKYETLFTLANGYRGLRGALEFSSIGERGNLIAGIFDKSYAQVTEIVNCQDPLGFNVYFEDEQLDFDRCYISKFNRRLNMKEGILYLSAAAETEKGKRVKIESERYVSQNNVHRWADKYVITPINFSGEIYIENIIDGSVTNSALDPLNKSKHIEVTESIDYQPGIGLRTKTLENSIEIIEASALTAENDTNFKLRKFGKFGEKVRELYEGFIKSDQDFTVYKLGISYSSRDTGSDIAKLSEKELKAFINDGYVKEKESHINAWGKIWEDIDIEIGGDDKAQIGIRFNLYQLSSSVNEKDEKISIPAKALHGEGYKGHVFWDTETFMLPFFIFTRPSAARSLLMYRYNTLEGARKNARNNGYKGAQFPWESAEYGVEAAPKWGIDFDGKPIRIWTGIEEYHINSDITFGIWEYYRATLDKEFMFKHGLEIFLDTAKFWNSRVEYNLKEDRYEINSVIGPDEFHEHVNNNAYTNYFVKWSLKKSLELADLYKSQCRIGFERLCSKLDINQEDFRKWDEIQQKIYIPISKDGSLIEQFQGYLNLPDAVISKYDDNGMPLWPELNGIRFNDTQLIKQADVVMLMLMLGEEFHKETKIRNYKYYEARTMHKSSLSPSMYSIMGLSTGDTHNAYKYFMKAVMTDIDNNQGNTEFGIHAASAGGSWQSAVMGFGGLSVDENLNLNINPWIPDIWLNMSFTVKWHQAGIRINVLKDKVLVKSTGRLKIKVYGQEYELKEDEEVKIKRLS